MTFALTRFILKHNKTYSVILILNLFRIYLGFMFRVKSFEKSHSKSRVIIESIEFEWLFTYIQYKFSTLNYNLYISNIYIFQIYLIIFKLIYIFQIFLLEIKVLISQWRLFILFYLFKWMNLIHTNLPNNLNICYTVENIIFELKSIIVKIFVLNF